MSQPTIQLDSTGPAVRWVQYLLMEYNLEYWDIDGVFGPKTKNAIEQFQSNQGLTVDGIVGPKTWATLGGNRPVPPTLANGSTGPVVKALQTALNEGRGDFSPNDHPALAVDGAYGPQTLLAVKGTQAMANVPADGIAGLQTWALPVHADSMLLGGMCGVTGPYITTISTAT